MLPSTEFDFAEYAEQVAEFVRKQLVAGKDRAGIAGHMHLLTVAIERDLERFGDAAELSKIACGPGCSACCVVNIAVLVPEAITITHFLRHHYPADQCNRVCARLEELHVKTRWLDDEERLYLREPCAFLDSDGRCLIHSVRPLLCRSISSLDDNTCHEAVVALPLGEPPLVAMNLFQKNLFESAYRGIAQGLADLGMDNRPWRLTPAILSLFKQTELVKKFIAGEQVVQS